MIKRIVSVLLVAIMLLGCLVSCSDNSAKIMQIGDISIDGIDFSTEVEGFVAESNYITEDVFKYLFLYFKEYNLALFKQYESYGSAITGDSKIPVGDTKEFWSCPYSKDAKGNVITFADDLINTVIMVFEDILSLENLAEKYGYVLPETYDEDFDKAVAEYIVQNGYDFTQGEKDITDSNGKILGWVKDRWAMQMMSEGISIDSWKRIFYTYTQVISQDITAQLEKNGIIKAEDDSVLKEKGEKEIKDKIDDFMKKNMKIKHIAYFLKVEEGADESSDDGSKATKTVESSETSELLSEEPVSSEETSEELSSGDASTDESSDESSDEIDDDLSPKEFNKQLREKCNGILSGLLDGTLNFDDEIKKSDVAASAEKFPNGIAATFEAFEQSFGESIKDLKVGDIKMYEYDGVIHIIQVQELTEADSGLSTELTEDDMKALRATSVSEALSKLLDKFKVAIVKDDALIEKYKKPWEIN